METNLVRLVEHWPLKASGGHLFPLFEAAVNSIHAIRAANRSDGWIVIRLLRDHSAPELDLAQEAETGRQSSPVVGFEVRDNGEGFKPKNFESFNEIGSDFKIKAGVGGKGVGRLSWLKAFSKVSVTSTFFDEGRWWRRQFDFRPPEGIINHTLTEDHGSSPETKVVLYGPKARYGDRLPKRIDAYTTALARHLMSFLLADDRPRIEIIDDDGDPALVDPNRVAEHTPEDIRIQEVEFRIDHVRLHAGSENSHLIVFCADGRGVVQEKLSDLSERRLQNEHGSFFYHAYVSSKFLDERASPDRTSFDIPEDSEIHEPLGFNEIRRNIRQAAHRRLQPELESARQARDARISKVLDDSHPEYTYVRVANERELAEIPLHATEREIEDKVAVLHVQNLNSGRRLLKETLADVRGYAEINPEAIARRFDQRFLRAIKVNEANLISYMLFRRSIIEILEEIISKVSDRFAKEAAIHNLIFPQGKTLDDSATLFDENNLWLIDERLTYANYVVSDKDISQHKVLFEAEKGHEPDLVAYFNLAFSADPNVEDLSEVVIVEFKRPGPLAAREETPYEQLTRYINKIRDGFYSESGKKIKGNQHTRFYCYVVCDLDNAIMEHMLNNNPIRPIFGGVEGYYGFNDRLNAYIEFIPFERLKRDATRRHRAFFDRLSVLTPGKVAR